MVAKKSVASSLLRESHQCRSSRLHHKDQTLRTEGHLELKELLLRVRLTMERSSIEEASKSEKIEKVASETLAASNLGKKWTA